MERFPTEVTQLFTGYIQALLQEYSRDPVRAWRAKDTAIYLVLALTVQGRSILYPPLLSPCHSLHPYQTMRSLTA